MSKLEKLRATAEAMTETPWAVIDDQPELVIPPRRRLAVDLYGEQDDVCNGRSIAALLNAAPALLEVIRLAEEWAKARDHFKGWQSLSMQDRFETASDRLDIAIAQLEDSLP